MLETSHAAPSVTRVDRWRYRSAVHAARVLNSLARPAATPAGPAVVRPRQSVESGASRAS
ncbi:hypothetical protein [Nocardioides sp. P5_C9_2]